MNTYTPTDWCRHTPHTSTYPITEDKAYLTVQSGAQQDLAKLSQPHSIESCLAENGTSNTYNDHAFNSHHIHEQYLAGHQHHSTSYHDVPTRNLIITRAHDNIHTCTTDNSQSKLTTSTCALKHVMSVWIIHYTKHPINAVYLWLLLHCSSPTTTVMHNNYTQWLFVKYMYLPIDNNTQAAPLSDPSLQKGIWQWTVWSICVHMNVCTCIESCCYHGAPPT